MFYPPFHASDNIIPCLILQRMTMLRTYGGADTFVWGYDAARDFVELTKRLATGGVQASATSTGNWTESHSSTPSVSTTHKRKETIQSHRPRLLPYPPLACTSGSRSPSVLTGFRFYSVIVPINRHEFTIHFYAFWLTICFHWTTGTGSLFAQAPIDTATSMRPFIFRPNAIFRFCTPFGDIPIPSGTPLILVSPNLETPTSASKIGALRLTKCTDSSDNNPLLAIGVNDALPPRRMGINIDFNQTAAALMVQPPAAPPPRPQQPTSTRGATRHIPLVPHLDSRCSLQFDAIGHQRSSPRTFLNPARLSPTNTESRPFQIEWDILPLLHTSNRIGTFDIWSDLAGSARSAYDLRGQFSIDKEWTLEVSRDVQTSCQGWNIYQVPDITTSEISLCAFVCRGYVNHDADSRALPIAPSSSTVSLAWLLVAEPLARFAPRSQCNLNFESIRVT
ncbi:uncharacterized protein LACBIDRAFT_331816 [Laccaria bicolor S238N-H82]|uniref:Predicted protein n=1 Tax=Laccaria bicolor (strain S238N-H82 / ATCC MYA-4686) TaxID=486041 RepID=B0DQN9_LACBS|nr:uncharacterized protein LACBIDRAFT_331816 [Laccaria bicolor S238N-H82]EDR03066.1 predicted protein [Laccaria bicolor S238N-H82]|eukprot:XP_001886207.1 predicted protein [Laccaria bicolor S238N-H82]